MDKSQEINELILALSRAQGEFQAVPFDAANPFLHNRYASLGSVIETAKEILSNHQLVVTQTVTSAGNSVGVTTMLAHSSGQWICDTVSLPLSDEKGKSLAQVAGSVVTYLRRYAYSSILGLYADEDTDGSEPEKKPTPKAENKKPVVTPTIAETKSDPQKQQETTPSQESTDSEKVVWFDKTNKPADGLLDIKNINGIMEKFVGPDKKFTAPAHLKNHLRKHYHVDTLQEMTWVKGKALIEHLKGVKDDPKWYPPEPVKVDDPESSSGFSDEYLNGIVALWSTEDKRLNGVNTYKKLPDEKKVEMMTFLTESVGIGKTIESLDDVASIAGYLAA